MASISLRPYEAARDRGFVIMSFVRSFGRSAYATGVDAAVLIDLLDPMLIVWPTTVAEAGDELLGWLCAKAPDHVAWLYVKPDFRRRGVARALLDHAEIGKQVSTPFMPTKSIDERTSFHAFTKARGYQVHFRPYLPLQQVAKVAGRKG